MTAKRQLLAAIESLPEDVTFEDAMERLSELHESLPQAVSQPAGLARHQGVLTMTEDALEFQTRLRSEWC